MDMGDGSEDDVAFVEFDNGYDLLNLEKSEECLSTGIPEVDALFGSGIPSATFLEVVGCSSTGKTQLCLQLSVMVQKRMSRKESVYVDTEGGFSTNRLCEIAQGHLACRDSTDFLGLIKHSRCRDLVELMSTIHRLYDLLKQNPEIGLVIVDSIAMPFRGETDYTKSAINSISSALSRIAVTFRCVVIVVNHVTTRFRYEEGSESSYLSSALGTSWSQRPCVRIWLCPPTSEMPYSLHLIKSPFVPQGLVRYRITASGLSAVRDSEENDPS